MDIEPVIEPPAAKVSITTPADDDQTFIGEVIKHSSSENSNTRIAVNDLANVITMAQGHQASQYIDADDQEGR